MGCGEGGQRDKKHEERLGMGTDERQRMRGRTWESDMEAVEQIKVKLSAFTYLDERFESACLIISSPFFICTPFNPNAAGREESFSPPSPFFFPLPPHHYSVALTLRAPSVSPAPPPLPFAAAFFVIRVITIHFLSVRTCSPYLPCTRRLLLCFMHARMATHMCPGKKKNARAGVGPCARACVRETAAQKVHR